MFMALGYPSRLMFTMILIWETPTVGGGGGGAPHIFFEFMLRKKLVPVFVICKSHLKYCPTAILAA